MKKRILTEEHKRKIGLAIKGKKRKSVSQKYREIRSKKMKGKPRAGNPENWKHSYEDRKKISLKTKLAMNNPKIRKKMSDAKKGKPGNNKGKHWKIKDTSKMNKDKIGKKRPPFSEEWKRKNREWHIAHPNRIFKDTSIELKIEEELKIRGINYQKQVPLCKVALVDFYLPEYRIIIQADGDYWHNILKVKERDIMQDKVLTFNGFNVYRFWEHEINESVENCINKLELKCSQ